MTSFRIGLTLILSLTLHVILFAVLGMPVPHIHIDWNAAIAPEASVESQEIPVAEAPRPKPHSKHHVKSVALAPKQTPEPKVVKVDFGNSNDSTAQEPQPTAAADETVSAKDSNVTEEKLVPVVEKFAGVEASEDNDAVTEATASDAYPPEPAETKDASLIESESP